MVRSYLSIRTLLLLLAMLSIFVLLLAGCSSQAQTPTVDKWVKIFNGKDLTGWTPKFKGYDLGVNYKNTFRVKDGLLKVSLERIIPDHKKAKTIEIK